MDRRVKEFLAYCEEVATRTQRDGKGFLYQVDRHASLLEGGLRVQVRDVVLNSLVGGEGYSRTIFLMNFCPFAFGRSCAYGPKSEPILVRND